MGIGRSVLSKLSLFDDAYFPNSKDIVLEIPIDVVHPMAIPQQPISGPYIQKQQLAPYTYANHAPVPGLTPYADHASYHPAYIDLTQIQPWLQAIEPPLLLHQGYPYGNATSSDPQLLPPFQPFYPIHESTGGHTPPPSHSSFLEAVPPPTLPYATSYQTPVLEPLRPVFIPQMAPQMDNFVGQIPVSNSSPSAMVHSPRPQLTPRHSFTRDPAFGSLTISKSERVEELEKMADEVAKRNRDLSGDLPGVAVAATGEHDEKINGDYSNFNKTLPGLPGKFGGRKKMGWDGDLISEAENHDRDVPQQTRDLMSVFPAAVHDHQTRDYHHPHEQPSTCGITYQTPPTPTLMAVLGPPKQALPLPLPPAPLPSATRMGKSPSDLLTSESGLDALERRLLAEVGTRKHLEPSDNSHHNNINTEESGEDSGRGRTKAALFKGHQLGRRDVRDVLSSSSSSPVVAGATAVSNGNQWLPRIDTDLDLEVAGSGGNGCGGNGSAPIPIPMKSPDPLNESAISSLILGSEGLASGLPGTGLGFSSAAAAVAAVNDSDGEGDGEADFDGRTHRAGSASLSGGSNSGSDRMALGSRGDGGGFHKHTRQRAEVSTPTNMIPQERNRSRRKGGGRGVEAKEKPKTSSSKKKQRLNDAGNDSNEPKKSRNKSSAAAKGRVTAWLGGIDPAVPPQEEIIPPSPSVIKDLDGLSFEDEQRAARRLLGSSPLVAAAPLSPNPDSASRTTPEGAIVSNTRTDVGANTEDENNNIDQDKAISAFPNPRSSGFIPITTLKRDTISLPSSNSVVRKPLLLSRDATVIEEARRVEDLWSLDQPDTTLLKLRGAASATSLLSDERIDRKPSPASSLSKPAGVMPLSYSAAVTSALPSAPGASSSAAAVPRKNADQTQSTSRPKGRPVPPSTTKPPGGKLLAFPPSKPPIDPEVKYDIRSARGGRGGKVSSVASLWASGAINNQRQTTAATATTSHSNEAKEVPKRLFNGGIEKTPDFLPSSSSALSKPVKAEKKLFSAAVMTPAPASKNVRAYMSTAIPGSGGGGSSGEPKKMASTSALPARSVGVFGGGKAGANRSSDNVAAMQKRSIPTAPASMNLIPGGKTTPTANLPTPSSSYGPPTGKLHELTKRGAGGTKGTGKPSINGPPGVIIKATSDPAVISSSHAVPTLSTTASLVIPHDQNSTSQKQDHPRHHLQPRGVVVKPSKSTTPGSGSRSVSPRPGSPAPPPEVGVVDNNSHSHSHAGNKPTELAFGQARLRHLIKKYQGSSPAGVGQKL